MNCVVGARAWHHFCSVKWLTRGSPSVQQNGHHQHLLRLHLLRRTPRCRTASSSSMDDGGHVGLALNLWQKNRSQAMMALYHPFVVSLAAGTLNIQTFRHYIAQDAFFLQAFATAYRLALENVDDDVSKLLINQLLHAALDELKLHSSYAQDWGVDLTKENKPNYATVKYTEFLLTTAAGRVVLKKDIPGKEGTVLDRRKLAALTIGAMTPCMRLYAFLGQEIAKILDENCWVTPYHEWVDTYSAEAFQASTLQIERLLENLAGPLGEDDIQHLENLYCQALSLELEFFSAQPDCQCALVPFVRRQGDGSNFVYLLMSDFDLTCSMTDSCPALANVSIEAATNKEKEHVSSMCHNSSLELRRTWDLLEKSYSDQYTTIILTLPEYTGPRSMLQQSKNQGAAASFRAKHGSTSAGCWVSQNG